MASMLRIKARWSGFTGSPGYSNFYFRDFTAGEPTDADADSAADRVDTFFTAVAGLLPAIVRVTTQSDAEVINDANGEITSVLNAGARAAIPGTHVSQAYSAASGAVITWRTNGVVAGRRVRGRTFLVPLANTANDVDGTLHNTSMTTLQNAATALVAAAGTPDLGVWARPTPEHTNAAGQIVPARDGSWWVANSATIPDKVAILRSRRD